jgi:hypothetical protein
VPADDSYDRAKTEARSEKLMTQNVFALVFSCEHAHGREVGGRWRKSTRFLPVGLLTGAQRLYAAAPLGNHVRASYFDETREQVDGLLKTLHYRKIAVIYPDDAVAVGPPNTAAPILWSAHAKDGRRYL